MKLIILNECLDICAWILSVNNNSSKKRFHLLTPSAYAKNILLTITVKVDVGSFREKVSLFILMEAQMLQAMFWHLKYIDAWNLWAKVAVITLPKKEGILFEIMVH